MIKLLFILKIFLLHILLADFLVLLTCFVCPSILFKN